MPYFLVFSIKGLIPSIFTIYIVSLVSLLYAGCTRLVYILILYGLPCSIISRCIWILWPFLDENGGLLADFVPYFFVFSIKVHIPSIYSIYVVFVTSLEHYVLFGENGGLLASLVPYFFVFSVKVHIPSVFSIYVVYVTSLVHARSTHLLFILYLYGLPLSILCSFLEKM